MSKKPISNLLVVFAFMVALLPAPAALAAPSAQEGQGAFSAAGAPQTMQWGAFPPEIMADVDLILDDGTSENAIGLTGGGGFIFLNRFTPDPGVFPFDLEEIQMYFYSGQGVVVGDLFDFYVYEDTDGDGDPATGAVYMGDLQDADVQALDDWSSWTLPTPITLNGPGDVLILGVNRTATAVGVYPATMDETSSQGRSYVGFYLAGDPADPPTLPSDDWYLIDDIGFPGNWMIRGFGSNDAEPPEPSTCEWEVLLEEHFESWPPDGWTIDYSGCGAWNTNTYWGRTNYAGGDGMCADADADACGTGMDTEMWTLPLDLTAAEEASIDFIAAYNYLSGDYFEVNVTTDGGATWDNLLYWAADHSAYGPGEAVSLDLTPYVGNSDVIVSFHYFADSWDWWAEVDQVVAEGCFPPPVLFEPETQTGNVCMGDSASYEVAVTNNTGAEATFDAAAVGNMWETIVDPTEFTLLADESIVLDVTVNVPNYAFDGELDVATIEVVSQADPEDMGAATVETYAGNLWLPAEQGGTPTLWPAHATVLGNILVYFDGKDESGAVTDQVQQYQPGVGWMNLSTDDGAYYGSVADWRYDGVWLAGGFEDGMVATDMLRLYAGPTSYVDLAPMPEALGLGGGGLIGDQFVWVGGSPDSGLIDYTPVYTYDIGTDTWAAGATLEDVAFIAPGYVVADDLLYVGGNWLGSDLFYAYDPYLDEWTQLADLPGDAGKVSPLFIYDGADDIYLIGGGLSPSEASGATYRYSISEDAWYEFAGLNWPTLGNGGGLVNGLLYTFGGGANSGAAQTDGDLVPHEQALLLCEELNTAVLSGYVKNGVTDEPIEGALVEAAGMEPGLQFGATPFAYTDENGYYELILYVPEGFAQLYNVTASYGDFDPQTEEVLLLTAGATQDFLLGPPVVNASPTSFDVTLPWGEQTVEVMDLANDGYSALDFEFVEMNGGLEPAPLSIPAFTGTLPERKEPASAGPAPDALEAPHPLTPMSGSPLDGILANEPAYAMDVYPGYNLVYIPDTMVPGTWNVVGNIAGSSYFAGDFVGGDFSQLYVLDYDTNNLYSVDTATAVPTMIGAAAPRSGENWTGATGTTGGMLYASSSACGTRSTLYTVDTASGATTEIGEITGATCIIDIAINASGEMYGVDIVTDALYEIDPATGAGTYVGSLGVSANYAQGMDFEETSGILYWASYVAQGELRVIDTSTGASALIGAFPGGAEVDCLAFPTSAGGGGGDIPWLTVDPISGTIPLLSDIEVDLTFDALAVFDYGVYTGTLVLNSDDPANAVIEMPLMLTVTDNPDAGMLQGTVTSDRPGGPIEGATVELVNEDDILLDTLTTDENGYYERRFLPIDLGVYTITVSADGFFTDVQTKTIAAPGPTIHDVELELIAPEIVVDPTLLEQTVVWGEMGEDYIDITNIGNVDLYYEVYMPPEILVWEEFEDWPPEGWTIANNGGNCVWMSSADNGTPNDTGGTGNAAAANSDSCGSGTTMDTELWTPILDLSDAANAQLTFKYDYWNYLNEDWAYVKVSTNGGADWTTVIAWNEDLYGPRTEVVDLTPFVGSDEVIISFHYVAPTWDWWWAVDDVLIEASSPAPWLGWEPTAGIVPTSTTDVLTITNEAAAVPMPGVYTAELVVDNNDPLEPMVPLDIVMNVVDNPDQGYVYGTVLGSRTAEGVNMPLEGALVQMSGPHYFETYTDENGEYEFYMFPWQVGTYVIYVTAPGYVEDISVPLPIGQGDILEHNVTLRLLGAWLMVDPEEISETLPWGGSTGLTMTVTNPPEAAGRLQASMIEIMPTFTPLPVTTVQVDVGASPAVVLAEGVVLDDPAAPAAPARTVNVRLQNLALQPLQVLIVSDDANQGALDGLDVWLGSYPEIDVDVWYSSDGFPTLADLMPYQAIIVGGRYAFSNAGAEWTAEALGDVMADYVDAGGGVIMIQNAWLIDDVSDAQYALGGRFEAELSPVDYQYSSGETYTYATRHLGMYLAGHPLMDDVVSITDYFRAYTDLVPRPYAEAVAYYDDGELYVAANPGKVVLLNQVLTHEWNWAGDVATLVHNAIVYLAPNDAPWLDETVTEFDLPVGRSAETDILLDASVPEVDQPGLWGAWLWFYNNDPLQQGAYVPVEMMVEADPTMGNVHGTVYLNRSEHGEMVPADGATVILDSAAGTAEIHTQPDGTYTYYYLAADLPLEVDITASYPDYQDDTATVTVVSGESVSADLVLELLAPWIQVSPMELEVTIPPDTQTTLTMDVENLGLTDLIIPLIQEIPATATLPVEPLASVITWVDKPFTVDAEVASALQTDGSSDFFIWMRERADLSRAYNIVDTDLRREFVYESLTQTAETSQAEIRKYLDARGFDYEAFWINNSILVRGGDLALVETMQARGDVYRIRGVYTQMYIPEPEQLAIVTLDGNSVNADPTWNIDIVNAPDVWEQLNITGEGAVVSNIDTGVRYTHEALEDSYRGNLGGGAFDHNYNWGSLYGNAPTACPGAPEAPCDWSGHGSHTMGTMIGGDGNGPFDMDIGMAPDAQWMACMGCDTPPNGCSDAALTGCAEWVVAPLDLNGENPDPAMAPDVVNNSWGGGGEDDWYYSYVEAWHAADIIPVFSAGNSGPGCSTLGSPGSYDNVFGTGGTDNADNNYTSTSRGPGSGTGVFPVQKPDLAAPAEGVPSSVNTSDTAYANYSGTSMAAPHMSGLVALMRSVNPAITFEEIWDIATANTVTELTLKNGESCGLYPDFPNYIFGYGRIDAFAALSDVAGTMDIPWLSLDPVSGTVPAAGTLPVEVTFDSTGLVDGVYTGTLRVLHNDPLTGQVLVPVTMNVETPMPELYIEKTADPAEQYAGELVTYTVTFGNMGDGDAMGAVMTDTLPEFVEFVDADPAGWTYDPVAHTVAWTVDLAAGAEIEATIWVSIMDIDATPGTWLTNTAELQWEEMSASAEALVYVLKMYELYLPLVAR